MGWSNMESITRLLRRSTSSFIIGAFTLGGVLLLALPLGIAAAITGASLVYCLTDHSILRRRRVFFVVSAISLPLLGLELALRLMAPTFVCYRPAEHLAERWPRLPLMARYMRSSEIMMDKAYGDLAAMSGKLHLAEYRRIGFRTDARGFRNSKMVQTEIWDGIILGDSFGVGNGTDDQSIWPTVLSSSTGRQFYNLSMPGSLWTLFANWHIEGENIKVKEGGILILTLFGGNDLDDWYYNPKLSFDSFPWATGYEPILIQIQNFQDRAILQRVFKQWQLRGTPSAHRIPTVDLADHGEILFFGPYLERAQRTAAQLKNHPNYQHFIGCLDAIAALAQQRGLSLLLVNVPTKGEIYHPRVKQESTQAFSHLLADYCEENQHPYLDLYPAFKRQAKGSEGVSSDLLWWRDDTHWNEKGHQLVARLISEKIKTIQRPTTP